MASYQENSSSSSNYGSSSSGTLPFYNKGMENLLSQGEQASKTPFQAYNAPLVAGATPLQQQAYGLAGQNVGNWQPLTNQAQGALSQLQGAGQFDPSKVQQYLNPYLGGVVNEIGRLGNEQFQNQVLPGLTSNFSSLGQQGSARQAMLMSQAAAQNQREVLGQQANALNTGYNNAMGSYLDWSKLNSSNLQNTAAGAANLGSSIQQMGNQDVGTLNTLGQQQQATQQKQLEADYGQFQRKTNYPWEQLNNWGNLFKVGTPQSSSSSSGSSSSSSGWSTAFKRGGLAQFAEGGAVEDDDITDSLVNAGLGRPSTTPMSSPEMYNEMARQAFQKRMETANQLQSHPAFQPREAPPMMMQLGEAMLRGSAAGPGNIGQLVGRAGTSFFDAEREREDSNMKKYIAQMGLIDKTLPEVQSMAAASRAAKAQHSPNPEQLRTVYTSAMNMAAQAAKDYDWSSAEERTAWIRQQADGAVKNYLSQWAAPPNVARGEAALPAPEVPQNATPKAAPAPAAESTFKKEDKPTLNFPGMTPQEVLSEAMKLAPGKDKTELLAALKEQTGVSAPATQVAAGPKRDKRSEEQSKSYGGEEGKQLFKEREGLTQLHGANTKILGQLNQLESIYKTPGMPEGELAPKIQQMRSALKSLGIEVSPSAGPADLAIAISTGMSLAQKNADGHNLLPGAMSNYEDQLLQKMAPTLSLTQEGRLSLIKFMKEVAASNVRIAQEGTAMAGANKNRLPDSWYQRKERIMLEEMARLKALSQQLSKGGK